MSNYRRKFDALFRLAPLWLILSMSSTYANSEWVEIDSVGYQYQEMLKRSPYKVEITQQGSEIESFYCHHWTATWKKNAPWAQQVATCINKNSQTILAGSFNDKGVLSTPNHESNNRIWAPDTSYGSKLHSNALDMVEITHLQSQYNSLTHDTPVRIELKRGSLISESFNCELSSQQWSSQASWSFALSDCLNNESNLLVAGQIDPLSGTFLPNLEPKRNRVLAPSSDYKLNLSSVEGTLTLHAPARPFGVEAEATKVTIVGSDSTKTVSMAWNETKLLELDFDSYQIYFGYQYDAIPAPTSRSVVVDKHSRTHELSWQMRSTSDVGNVVLAETCQRCHGEDSYRLNKESYAERWFGLGFDGLVATVDRMSAQCDDVCAQQTARTLWLDRWGAYNPPELPGDGQPTAGDAPKAILSPLVQSSDSSLQVSFTYSSEEHDLTWAPVTGARQQLWWGNVNLAGAREILESGQPADEVWHLEQMQTAQWIGNYYSSVVRGFFVPEVTGDYHLYIAGNDHYELYLGSSLASMSKIAGRNSSTGFNQWNRFAEQKSSLQHLIKGELYYLEALYMENSGNDHVSVGWQMDDGNIEVIAAPLLGSINYMPDGGYPRLASHFIDYRYLQPEPSAWKRLELDDLDQRTATLELEFGGEIEVRVVSFDQQGGITYSESELITVDTLATSSVSNQSLELYWNFDDPDVFQVRDHSGHQRHLPLVTQRFTPQGLVGEALLPNNGRQDFFLSDEQQMDLSSNGMSVSFWTYAVKPTGQQNKLFETQYGWFSRFLWGTTFRIGPDPEKQRFSIGNFPLNQWVHVVYTRESNGQAVLYIDGVKVASGIHNLDIKLPNLAMNANSNLGKIDETRVYSRVLSPAEVLALHQMADNSGLDSIDDNNGDNGSRPPVADMDGAQIYQALNCVACHGTDGRGQTPIIDSLYREDILDLISMTMPYGKVGSCDLDCAQKLYDWMYTTFIDGGGGNPPIGGGDTGLDHLVANWEARGYLYKLTENLVSRQPTDDELSEVDQYGAGALEGILDQLIEEEDYLSRIEEIYNDLLHMRKTPNVRSYARNVASRNGGHHEWYEEYANGNNALRNYLRTQTNAALQGEALALIRFVVDNNLPFSEILTANYTMVNAFSAHYYGVQGQVHFRSLDDPAYPEAPWDPADYQMVNLGYPHAGVVSTPAYLITYPTTATNINRARSATFYAKFLDTDIMAIGGSRPSSDDLEAANATLANPACTGCHSVMDPVASAFKHWVGETYINYKSLLSEKDWPLSTLLPLAFNGESADYYEPQPLPWLTERAAQDPRFARATVKHLFVPITGHELMSAPIEGASDIEVGAYQRQQQDISKLAERFIAGGYQLKALTKDLLLSEYAPRFNRFGGTRRLLTPELLDRKVSSLFGREWRYRGDTQWLSRDADKLNLMYGGTDDKSVTERDYRLNGVSAAVQNFFAHDFACQIVPFEFSQLPDNRQIFNELSPEGYRQRFELEEGELEGAVVEASYGNHTGTGYVTMTSKGQSITHQVNLVHSDQYQLNISYQTNTDPIRYLELWIDGEFVQELVLERSFGGGRWRNAIVDPIYLEAGQHQVQIVKSTNGNYILLDNISFRPLAADEERVRQLLADLHWRFYGEEVDVSDDQVERAYQLLRFAQQVGQQEVYERSVDYRLDYDCRASQHLRGDEVIAINEHVSGDVHYYTRSWIAVMTYLLQDQRFFYE